MHKSKDVLKTLSKIAADNYLKNPKGSLKAELQKIAQQESITPVQVTYLTSEANQQVWKHLYDMDKKASYAFKPVDPQDVVKELQVKEPVTKTASEDYLAPPEKGTREYSWNATIATVGMQKVATDKRQLKHELRSRMEKMAQAKEDFEANEIVLQSEIERLETQFVKQARQMLLEMPFAERHEGLHKIGAFVRAAVDPKKAKKAALLIAKIAHVLKSQGLVKVAELQAPDEYINYSIPARIVNGNHSLYITINTLQGKWNELEQQRAGREIVDSTLPKLEEKIRGL